MAVSRRVGEPEPVKDFELDRHIAKHTSHLFTVVTLLLVDQLLHKLLCCNISSVKLS